MKETSLKHGMTGPAGTAEMIPGMDHKYARDQDLVFTLFDPPKNVKTTAFISRTEWFETDEEGIETHFEDVGYYCRVKQTGGIEMLAQRWLLTADEYEAERSLPDDKYTPEARVTLEAKAVQNEKDLYEGFGIRQVEVLHLVKLAEDRGRFSFPIGGYTEAKEFLTAAMLAYFDLYNYERMAQASAFGERAVRYLTEWRNIIAERVEVNRRKAGEMALDIATLIDETFPDVEQITELANKAIPYKRLADELQSIHDLTDHLADDAFELMKKKEA